MLVGVNDCCRPGSTCQCSQWVKLPTDAPAGFRAPLGGLQEYAGQACLDVRNDKGRAASDPCAVFCGTTDVGSWKRLTEKLIRDGRASCHRVGKCERVERLAAIYEANTSTLGMVKFITHGNLIERGIAPIAQELSCLIASAAQVGPHPDAPTPLPAPPPVGPGPSPGWLPSAGSSAWPIVGLALVAALALDVVRGQPYTRRR